MKQYVCTVNTEQEKNEWVNGETIEIQGRKYKYIAEQQENSNRWKIYLTKDK